MTDIQKEVLTTLRRQEAVLHGLLQNVRYAIQTLQSEGTPRPRPPRSPDEVDLLIDQVLARLGEQFTSVEIFETAKKLKPGLARSVLKTLMERLVNIGLILKVEDGRGRRPARYRKQVFN